jgi:hypothetical protein
MGNFASAPDMMVDVKEVVSTLKTVDLIRKTGKQAAPGCSDVIPGPVCHWLYRIEPSEAWCATPVF